MGYVEAGNSLWRPVQEVAERENNLLYWKTEASLVIQWFTLSLYGDYTIETEWLKSKQQSVNTDNIYFLKT